MFFLRYGASACFPGLWQLISCRRSRRPATSTGPGTQYNLLLSSCRRVLCGAPDRFSICSMLKSLSSSRMAAAGACVACRGNRLSGLPGWPYRRCNVLCNCIIFHAVLTRGRFDSFSGHQAKIVQLGVIKVTHLMLKLIQYLITLFLLLTLAVLLLNEPSFSTE